MPGPTFFVQGLVLFLFMFNGCAGLQQGFETPSVSVTSFRALPGPGTVPQFEIGLHITNPNRQPLKLKGISYTVSIEGHPMLTGVANQLPVIEAYGQGDVMLTAGVDLFSGIQFLTELTAKKTHHTLTYSLDAKLDPGTLSPVIRVSKKGVFSLRPGRQD